jgi:hypothetical protein
MKCSALPWIFSFGMALTGCSGGADGGERPSNGDPAGGQDGGWPAADAGVDAPPPPSSSYSPTSPHWPHIRIEGIDFMGEYLQEPMRSEHYDWAARHLDAVMGGQPPLPPYMARNPFMRATEYVLVLTHGKADAAEQLQESADMLQWYGDPSLNTQGYSMEDAFLHETHPRTRVNRKVVNAWGGGSGTGAVTWTPNPADPGYIAYSVWRFSRMIHESAPGYPLGGVHIDGMDVGDVKKSWGSVEVPGNEEFMHAITAFLQQARAGIGMDKVLHPNLTVHGDYPSLADHKWADPWAIASGSAHWEAAFQARRESEPTWLKIERMIEAGVISYLMPSTNAAGRDEPSAFTAGLYPSVGDRSRMYYLAAYYMIRPTPGPVDPPQPHVQDRLDLVTFGFRHPHWDTKAGSFQKDWIEAAEVYVGHPMETRRVYWEGTMPNPRPGKGTGFGGDWTTWPWRVWGREYDEALVLARPQLNWDHAVWDDGTAQTVQLPAGHEWWLLHKNSTLDPTPLTEITLRNGEAVILMKGKGHEPDSASESE